MRERRILYVSWPGQVSEITTKDGNHEEHRARALVPFSDKDGVRFMLPRGCLESHGVPV